VVYGILYRGVCVGTGGLCSAGCGWERVVVAWAGSEWLLSVRSCMYVVFMVLHWLWASSVVVRLVRGNGCVVWLGQLVVTDVWCC